MKNRKRALLAITAGMLCFGGLTGCFANEGNAGQGGNTAAGTDAQDAEKEPEDTEKEPGTEASQDGGGQADGTEQGNADTVDSNQSKEELAALLEDIRDKVEVGTAGSSLKSAGVANALLEWGASGSLSEDEVKAETSKWIESLEDEKSLFLDNLSVVDSVCKDLQGGDAYGLLETAGIDAANVSWTDSPEPMVEAVMEAAGLR